MNGHLPNRDKRIDIWRYLLGYGSMIATGIILFCIIRYWGEHTSPIVVETKEIEAAKPPAPSSHDLLHLLAPLIAILIFGKLLGFLLGYCRQPQVIGEVVAGILLGPTFLGWVAPSSQEILFPPSVLPSLNALAQLGILLYMFLVGLELDLHQLQSHVRITLVISHASILIPFLAGMGLALYLHPIMGPVGISFTTFAMFLGVAMAITAFPVLARILTDRKMEKSTLGVLSLTCAAIGDITAWCMLAVVVGVARSQFDTAIMTCILTVVYLLVMLALVRPLLAQWVLNHHNQQPAPLAAALILIALLVSAMITEAIGIHAIFGAFLFGLIIPHESSMARFFTEKLDYFVSFFLLPAFFAITGLRTQIGLVNGIEAWLIFALILGVATAGKIGGSMIAGRLNGLDWRTASSLGVLMNTRGLMELIVLKIGLDLGVISPTLFAMMVLMALATTLMTTPLLDFIGTCFDRTA